MERGASLRRTRFTYFLFFRVVVVSLLLAARAIEEWTSPLSAPAFGITPGLLLVIVCYGSAIVLSLALGRAHDEAAIDRVAVTQVVFDLLASTALVQLTGGVESQLAFTFLIVVAGAGLSIPRGALRTAVAAMLLLGALVLCRQYGLLPMTGQLGPSPTREIVRALMLNSLAVLATGALAGRLAVEIARTGESLASKNTQFDDLAALYANVVRSLSSGLLTIAADGRVATANHAALAILGLDAGSVLGRPLGDSLPGIAPLLDSAGVIRREEVAFVDQSNKPRRIGVTVSPLVDSADRQLGQIVTFQDLTELRQMEEAVTRGKRLAAIGRLAAGIAHEIRNPLAAISGSIELLVSSGVGDASPEARELGGIVQRETERLNGLITQLLEFARPHKPDLIQLDLAESVTELVQVWKNDRRLGDTRIELTAPSEVRVEADEAQLRQVVWNLLRNASEAAPGGVIRVAVRSHAGRALLVVSDDGPGISDDQLSRIFEPFFSTKPAGTGLGLPTVHRIVEEHRGSVELTRNPDGGTTATVSLPAI